MKISIDFVKTFLKENISLVLLVIVLVLNLGSMTLSSLSESINDKREDKCKQECIPSSHLLIEDAKGKKACWCYVDDSSLQKRLAGDEN